ncbi:hypothetical protein BKA69DRAFT_1036989 [Paraphysoderma sedebokerense]|nr:hypothetical protein BKA69DRAFT_1036989 [Paraphysoderma sedebokerense]
MSFQNAPSPPQVVVDGSSLSLPESFPLNRIPSSSADALNPESANASQSLLPNDNLPQSNHSYADSIISETSNFSEDSYLYDGYYFVKDDDISHFSAPRKFCYNFFYRPNSLPAKIFGYFNLLVVFLVLITLSVETLPQFSVDTGSPSALHLYNTVWLPLEAFATAVFTVDYLGSFYGSPNRKKYFFRPSSLIDLLTIVPFYISFFVPDDLVRCDSPYPRDTSFAFTNLYCQTAIRILRAFKMFRIFHLFRVVDYSPILKIVTRTMINSIEALFMLLLYTALATVVSATLMYYIERGTWDSQRGYWVNSDGEKSDFQSIPEGFYWSVTTWSTTGYGDRVPNTPGGMLVAGLTMFVGVTLIALPISILSTNFMQEWQYYRRLVVQRKLRYTRARESRRASAVPSALNPSPGASPQLRPTVVAERASTRELSNQNAVLWSILLGIQSNIEDINPPRYYVHYQKLQQRHNQTVERLRMVEQELENWKRMAQQPPVFKS